MRLVHVVPTYFPAVRYGGPIWSVHSLCKALVRRGHDVEVVTTNVDGPGNLNVPVGHAVDLEGVAVHYFPSRLGRRLFWSPQMKNHLHRTIPTANFVHLHYIFLWPTLVAARLAERYSVPWCVAPRGALVPELVMRKSRWVKGAWLSLFERRTLEKAEFIHAISELEAQDMARFGFDLPPVRIVPNGVEIPALETPARLPQDIRLHSGDSPLLLFLGRVSWKKGLDRLIPALARVPTASLVVAGNDEENLRPRLTALAQAAGVAERVFFVGPVYGEKKTALLRCASLLVLPSYSENFGNVVLESLAVGRPVAVTAEVGLASMVEVAGVGAVIPADPVEMGDALAALLTDPARLDEMGERGCRLVRSRYSWDTIAGQMEAVYAEAIAARKKCVA